MIKIMKASLWLPTNSSIQQEMKLSGWMILRIVSVITNYYLRFYSNARSWEELNKKITAHWIFMIFVPM